MTNNFELLKTHLYKLIKEELEGGEEEKQAGLEKALYDLVLEPADLQAALTALQNSKNYGIYAKNLTDRNEYNKIFGPNIPAQKANAAWKDWDSMFPKPNDNEDQVDSLLNKRLQRIKLVKNNNPEDWEKLKDVLSDKFKDYSIETGDDSFEDFIASLPSTELRFEKGIPFFGKSAGNYFLPKTKENSDRYTGTFKDDQYIVKGDKIVFPQKKNPFETKDYLTKVLKTIMGNAKLQYSISQQESDDQPATTSNTQGKVEKINFIKTFDTPELAAKFKKLIPKDFAEKTTVDGGKITVSDITDSQKKNLITSALQFIASQPKKPMKESIKDQIKQAVMEVLQEKKLTKAEKNKKEDIVKAMAKQGAPKDSKTYAIATAKAKKLAEGEEDTSMDDILDAFQAALAIEDDAKADQALKAVYNALKSKVKSKAGDLYQKARVGFAKSQGIDPSELNEAWVNSNTEDRISYLKPVLQHVWNMGKGNNMIDFDSMAENIVSDLFDDNLDEARFEKGTDIGKKGPGFKKVVATASKEYGSKEAGQKVAGAILKKVLNKKK